VPTKKPKAAPSRQPYRDLALGYDLRETSRTLLRALQTRIAPHDVTLNQFFLLRQLWEGDGVSQREISERMQTSEPATVAAIDGLEKRGYVQRVRENRDRRVVSIFLTPKGEALRGILLQYAADLNRHGTATMTRAEIATLHALLLRFRENLDRYVDEPVAGTEAAG
jgi:DNA-binding MarR family transcriptional regulator